MRVMHVDTIMELTRRIPEVTAVQCKALQVGFQYDRSRLLGIAAAAIRAAQEISDAE